MKTLIFKLAALLAGVGALAAAGVASAAMITPTTVIPTTDSNVTVQGWNGNTVNAQTGASVSGGGTNLMDLNTIGATNPGTSGTGAVLGTSTVIPNVPNTGASASGAIANGTSVSIVSPNGTLMRGVVQSSTGNTVTILLTQ